MTQQKGRSRFDCARVPIRAICTGAWGERWEWRRIFSTIPQAPTSLSASVDKNLAVNLPSGPTPFTNTFHPTIEQNGIFYFASIPGPSLLLNNGIGGQTGYNTISGSLTATDFTEFNFTTGLSDGTNPNFAGAPMLFGLTQVFSGNSGGPVEIATAQYDNLLFAINVPSAVPE